MSVTGSVLRHVLDQRERSGNMKPPDTDDNHSLRSVRVPAAGSNGHRREEGHRHGRAQPQANM